jgi:hypothetical protein
MTSTCENGDESCETTTKTKPKSFFDLSAKDIDGKVLNFKEFEGFLILFYFYFCVLSFMIDNDLKEMC